MSLEALHAHHERVRHVSRKMLTAQETAALMRPYLAVAMAVAEDEKYVVAGCRREGA